MLIEPLRCDVASLHSCDGPRLLIINNGPGETLIFERIAELIPLRWLDVGPFALLTPPDLAARASMVELRRRGSLGRSLRRAGGLIAQ